MIIKKGIGFDPEFVLKQPLDIITYFEDESRKVIEQENEYRKSLIKMGGGAGAIGAL